MTVTLYSGGVGLEVVGESFYQDNLRRAVREFGREVAGILIPEPENEHDSNAVGVFVSALKVGHLSREDAATFQRPILRMMKASGQPVALTGRIVGGDKKRSSLGIWLYHDPSDFGLSAPADSDSQKGAPEINTGASEFAQDWMDGLSTDRRTAIRQLRRFLDAEQSPLQRHFMFNLLEEHLYACREVFESALAEFEATCVQHDLEMVSIRPALLVEFGGVPTLRTYKQMAIMKQKAHLFEESMDWSNRGLAIYGEQAMRQDAREDLLGRVERMEKRLAGSDNKSS